MAVFGKSLWVPRVYFSRAIYCVLDVAAEPSQEVDLGCPVAGQGTLSLGNVFL